MIKKTRLLLLLVTVLCFTALFASCKKMPALNAPTGVTLDEAALTISWNAVENAQGYVIDINGEQQRTKKCAYSLSALKGGTYAIKVLAIGDGEVYADSAWSETVTYIKEPETGMTYKQINGNTAYEVVSAGSATGDVVIGAKYRGKPVVSIAASAFSGNRGITSLEIEEGIREIGDHAFYNCSYMTSVTLPESLESLGSYAFQSCRSLTKIKLPNRLTKVEDYTFSYCRALTEITFGTGIRELAAYAFSDCDKLTTVTLPDTLRSIGEMAFSNCGLQTVTLGNGVQTIGESAFYRCSELSTVTLGSALTSIGNMAFSECIVLDNVTVPDSVVSVGNQAFYSCVNLKTVHLGNGVQSIGTEAFNGTAIWIDEPTELVYVGDWLVGFKDANAQTEPITKVTIKENTVGIAMRTFYASKLQSVVIPDSVRYINTSAFNSCPSLYAVSIGAAVVSIDDSAFLNCKLLSNVIINSTVLRNIGANAFARCGRLDRITVPDRKDDTVALPASVERIGSFAFKDTKLWTDAEASGVVYVDKWVVGVNGEAETLTVQDGTVGVCDYAFYKTQAVKRIDLPDSVKIVGTGAFYGGGEGTLMQVRLPAGLTVINDYLFYRCFYLQSVNIPQTVTSVGRSAFHECVSLATLELPTELAKIADYAFYGCASLTSIKLGDRLTSVGASAFSGCKAVTKLEIGSGLATIGERAFNGCDALVELKLSEGLQTIGAYAFNKCIGLVEFTIPGTVVTIGERAFYGCTALKSLSVPDNVKTIGDYAFYGCGLQKLMLGNGLETIGDYAFRNCTVLHSVVIGNNITNMGMHAFYGCKILTVYCEAEKLPAGWSAIWNSSYRPVVWGCTLSEDRTYVVSFTKQTASIANSNAKNGIAAPKREGYVCVGWATEPGKTPSSYRTDEEGTENAEGYGTGFIYLAPNGTTLYAVWDAGSAVDGDGAAQ